MCAARKTAKAAKLPKGKKALSAIDADPQTAAVFFMGMPGGIGEYRLTDFESYLRAGSGKVWAAYKACRLVADVFCTTPWSLQKEDSTEAQTDAWLQPLIGRPNTYDTWTDFLARWVFHMKLTGNSFALKDETNGLGWPRKLWLLNPKAVVILRDPKKGVVGYKYRVNEKWIIYDTDEIVHWRLPNPNSEVWGLGEIEAGEELFNTVLAQSKFQEKFYSNGAAVSGIMAREEEMDEREFKKLKAKWQEEYGGSKNAGKTAWITGKWEYKRLGLTFQEMEATASRKGNIEEIFSLMGIPLSVAGVGAAANYATSQQDDVKFRRYAVLPLLRIFADRFNEEVVRVIRPDLWFCFNLAGLAYIKEVVEDYKELLASAGITPNELRDIVGIGRVDNPLLDKYYIGTHLVPLDLVGQLTPGANTGADNRSSSVDDTAKSIAFDQARLISREMAQKKTADPVRFRSVAVENVGKSPSSTKGLSVHSIQIGKPSLPGTSANAPRY